MGARQSNFATTKFVWHCLSHRLESQTQTRMGKVLEYLPRERMWSVTTRLQGPILPGMVPAGFIPATNQSLHRGWAKSAVDILNEGVVLMAGHNKWSKIKRKKGAADQRRAKILSKLSNQITSASRSCKGDRENAMLQHVMAKARAASMPKDVMEKAIKKGADSGTGGDAHISITYEGLGPGGVAVVVETLTDNKVRTVGEVRHIFRKHGGNLGNTGSVAWMFDRLGAVTVEADEDSAFDIALEAGGNDVEKGSEEGQSVILCSVSDVGQVASYADSNGVPVLAKELFYQPNGEYIDLTGERAETFEKFLEALEDCQDVTNVTFNARLEDSGVEDL